MCSNWLNSPLLPAATTPLRPLALARLVELGMKEKDALVWSGLFGALAAGVQNWMLRRTTVFERWLLIIAGLALVYPKPVLDVTTPAVAKLVNETRNAQALAHEKKVAEAKGAVR